MHKSILFKIVQLRKLFLVMLDTHVGFGVACTGMTDLAGDCTNLMADARLDGGCGGHGWRRPEG